MKDVTVYAANREAALLSGIHLTVRPGERIAVVGGNGSGKSTLARVIAGIMTPSSGKLSRGFASGAPIPFVMQQDEQLFGETPWEDVCFVLETRGVDPARIPAITERVLDEVGLRDRMHEPIAALSGGQRQLAAAAGCLAAEAPLLLFDEATSMLDASSRRQVLQLADKLHRKGRTIIWITHHMEEAAECQRIVALLGGAVAFDGSATQFFYGDRSEGYAQATPCEQAGYTLPYAIQVARIYMREGGQLPFLPLNAEQLVKAVQEDG